MSCPDGVGCGQGDTYVTHFMEMPDIWEHLRAQELVSSVGWMDVLMSLQRIITMGHLRGTDSCPQWVHGSEEEWSDRVVDPSEFQTIHDDTGTIMVVYQKVHMFTLAQPEYTNDDAGYLQFITWRLNHAVKYDPT